VEGDGQGDTCFRAKERQFKQFRGLRHRRSLPRVACLSFHLHLLFPTARNSLEMISEASSTALKQVLQLVFDEVLAKFDTQARFEHWCWSRV